MAKKYWDNEITLKTDWAGDNSTGNLPVSGKQVQKVIKDSINSKVGYVGIVEKTGQNFYVLCRDEETFELYKKTITEEQPFGDLSMDGVNGRFDAPFNYKMEINVSEPPSGYKSSLVGSTGNIIKFTAQTLDANNTPQGESLNITFKVITEGGVENSYTAIYDGAKAASGIEYNLDGKLGIGQNVIVITAVGMNTGISAMRRISYRIVDMSFIDKFEINSRYQYSNDGSLNINVGYSLKGVGKTRILWYFDGNQYANDVISNTNPNLQNAIRKFKFNKNIDKWLTPGIHNIQILMVCVDTETNDEFQTPIYFREFIVEETPAELETPFILRKTSFPSVKSENDDERGFLNNGENPVINNVKRFETTDIEYVVYYNGKRSCDVSTHITYAGLKPSILSEKTLQMYSNGFSEIQKESINLEQEGDAEITLKTVKIEESFETKFILRIDASDMNISYVTEDIALYLSAFGRNNNSSDRNTWTYTKNDGTIIETTFPEKNEYTVVSTKDKLGNIYPPSGATSGNTLTVDNLPITEDENFKYVKYENEYYVWTRVFDWSNTSGWADNKLKLSNGNAITINYMPFSTDKLANLKERGGTFEFEFETTNVYNDNAVICSICGTNNYAPGINIYASGAELVISREIEEPVYDENGEIININAGYIKAVSTKYKSEESNRISFVITPNSDKNADGSNYRNRILKIYVNGELCGAYPYNYDTSFLNDSKITFRGSEDACVNISSVLIYEKALNSNEILGNYIYFRNNTNEKTEIYKRNDIMLSTNDETFDSDKLKSQLPIMTFYQIDDNQSLDDIHQEKKNKKLTRFFDVVYVDIQNPSKNFLIKNAYVTPQGTSSMNYPVKNLRLYTGKKDKSGNYYSRLFVGSNIFIDGSSNNINWDNINLESEVTGKRLYSFKDATSTQKAAAPVNCWCLKADFAESSSSHNTGTARYWNNVLKSGGFTTKAQAKSEKYQDLYDYDVRTTIDGFPIAVFYQAKDAKAPRFEGKYNFNNDKSTESVFGFTGGKEINSQEVKYFYIGDERPIIQSETDEETGKIEYACSWSESGYTETPNSESPLYTSDDNGKWYMLRGKELFDNPRMECWEILNSVNDIALFKTMDKFGVGDGNEKVGIVVDDKNFDAAFESRYPDCGDYYHINNLKRFGEWLVSCRYLDIDSNGKSVPFIQVPSENYYKNEDGKISICSLTKQTIKINFDFPGVNFYKEVNYDTIKSSLKEEGYRLLEKVTNDILSTLTFKEVNELPTIKDDEFEYLKYNDAFYTWLPSNYLSVNELPENHEIAYDYILVEKDGEKKYYVWDNVYDLTDYHPISGTNEPNVWVDDTAFNRALKFAIEKYDHIDMEKMAAYYIYLMRFGGVDQTVKNAMLTTEGPATDDPLSTLPSLWFFINYDNDTILGVKNDGRLVFDPYITRQTPDGTGYVYAGRESTLWNNLEEDKQFMETVTTVDNILAKGEGNSLYALSYNNAIREYDTNQSDKWCERIYNKDAERKYIQTYVEGWTQRNDEDGTVNENVYEDYLYDVHGSRSAHRKWWLGRRFNVFDSKFCNTNFMNSLIKFRSTNLPAGAEIKIKSGEPVFYAWGHDNTLTEMTPNAIQPGDTYTFITKSAFNIGSYIELMGSANITSLDLRGCVGALTEIDITGCYSPSVGTKMKEILIGDNSRTDLINMSTTDMKFSGLNKASKLEKLDITNIKNITSLDGLSELLNIREVYAKGTKITNFTFADGALIEKLELPSTIETLSLTKSSFINYDDIKFENDNFGTLTNLKINNCSRLMNDTNFIFKWINSKSPIERENLTIDLQGINWEFDSSNLNDLLLLENVGISGLSYRNISGVIKIKTIINEEYAKKFKDIFGENCFKEGSIVYIDVSEYPDIFIDMPDVIWEGENDVKCNIITVGTELNGTLTVLSEVGEVIKDENGDDKIIYKLVQNTDGDIVLDDSTLNKDYITYSVKESDNIYRFLLTTVSYNNHMVSNTCTIKKRIYPDNITIETLSDSFNNKLKNNMWLNFSPQDINDINLIGRGNFSVNWELYEGTSGYNEKLLLHNDDKERAQIEAPTGWDGMVTVKVTITRNYDNSVICEAFKSLEFKNPETIVTKISNEPLYNILVSAGIIKENEDNYGYLTKNDASYVTMESFVKDGKSIFMNNTSLTSFVEFQWFTNSLMGQMPQEGRENVLTPDGMFSGCTNLVEISLPRNFVYTANNMFSGCKNLKHIYGHVNSYDENNEPTYNSLSIERVGDKFAYNCTSLETCNLSLSTKFIGEGAFYNCSKLTKFTIPGNSELEIKYSKDNGYLKEGTPFIGCYNITFDGIDYDKDTNIKYRVKDGSCYKINDDGTVDLIHMGKDSLMENIPTDKTVYAFPYSMEYRTEDDIVIPSNVVFNGDYILQSSTGNTIKLNNIIGDSGITCSYLFHKCNYIKYHFNENETVIPNRCFFEVVNNFTEFNVPNGITKIGEYAFYNCTKLEKITFPSSIEEIRASSCWLCSSLKTLVFDSECPPNITTDDFFNVMLDNIYVKPEYYENYILGKKGENGNIEKEPIMYLIRPFVTISNLYTEGYLRIIKDGNYLNYNDSIRIGNDNDNVYIEQFDEMYMRYTCNTTINDINVYFNDEVIGKITGKYTTLYMGDNSSLYHGDGFNFTKGIYDETLKQLVDGNGWVYDSRFSGIRNRNDIDYKEIEFNLPDIYDNKQASLVYGQYAYSGAYSYFKNSSEDVLNIRSGITSSYNEDFKFTTEDGIIKVGFKSSNIHTGIDGIVLKTIGETIYSDPGISSSSRMNLKEITINLSSTETIPSNVHVTVSDGEKYTYCKYWNGEPMKFVIPNNSNPIMNVSDFINENGKIYIGPKNILIDDNFNFMDITFEVKTGIEVKNNILCYYGDNTDWFINLNVKNGKWGSIIEIDDAIYTNDILISDVDGLNNTKEIAKIDNTSICYEAITTIEFEKGIVGYIPSYIELELLSSHLPIINEYLSEKHLPLIDLSNCWTSEVFDKNNAWNSDGMIIEKHNNLNYYIFGKRITL